MTMKLNLSKIVNHDDGEGCNEAKSPIYVESRSRSGSGAMRSGPVQMYMTAETSNPSRHTIMCYGALSNLIYPLSAVYFHMTGRSFNSVTTLIGIRWSFREFIGLLRPAVWVPPHVMVVLWVDNMLPLYYFCSLLPTVLHEP
ncbi:hypothetical protein H310_00163 [Aphanomyces invadans]|uniref:Uncharacterized protein n=1 Tax=Aphanomyces invadans TaxID=157072 RepID=A0A024USX8_9STRA|nr:hypothetical protein H310_00163 [Aphanomyces invadans]ETW09631.1 hypothetical protein H310_00163 [Aphanomyces invadans]|eukprot:XP_008861042.1 hypothetical protein H310_00163 [Aphanomyces invadans]